MNYLQQILAFDDYLLYETRLSAGQIALWRALMSINNKAQWKEWFTAANITIESLSGLSRSGINKNRNVLKQLGLIDFRTNGRKASSYRVCVLYTSNSTQESVDKVSLKYTTQDPYSAQQSSTFLNINNKQNINSNSSPIPPDTKSINNAPTREGTFGAIEQEFGRALSPIERDYVNDWFNQGFTPELVECALKEATLAQAWNLKYMNTVLYGFRRRDIKNIAEYKQAKDKHDRKVHPERAKNHTDGPKIPLFKITEG